MISKPDSTPQFYDAHTGYRSPVNHRISAAAVPPPKRARNRKASPLTWVIMVGVMAFYWVFGNESATISYAPPVPVQQMPADDDDPSEAAALRYYQAGDYARAFRLYTACAGQGDAECQRSLAYMYSVGQAVQQSDEQAFHWLLKAARQGNATAQDDLGVMYGDGKGVAQNWVQSFLWIARSAAQGNTQAREDLKYVLQHMNPQERAQAMRLWEREKAQGASGQVAR